MTFPRWAAEEIAKASWSYLDTWRYTGYILDIDVKGGRIDVQFYDRLPEGRYIATLDVDSNLLKDLVKGEAYMFEFRVFRAGLSSRLIEFLKKEYSLDMDAIYRFELLSAERLGE